jgi:hypothetical protein
MPQDQHPYNEAGRRIKAALVSYQMGMKGVDRTLKEMPEYPGDGWAELAEKLLRGMNERVVEGLLGPTPDGQGRIQ